jgi:uncharacterized protein (DUF1684 family)
MTTDPEAYEAELEANRAEKDEFFAEHPQSPIPPEDREAFDGLAYFPPDLDYRVEAEVTVYDEPETLSLAASAGPDVEYERICRFDFDLDGAERSLQGYRRPDDESLTVFVPFRDKTTGQQTYEDGRYLELEPESALADGDDAPIDFNLAYNPFCAYSETFACPLAPEANWLEVPITAGERWQ